MTQADVIEILQELVRKRGTQVAAAKHLGISPQHFGDLLRGHRTPGNAILEKLGLVKVITIRYEPKDKNRWLPLPAAQA